MPFVVDTVTEITYYENLLLGLTNALHKYPGVKHTYLKKLLPAAYSDITSWEFKQGVQMPADLRAFYSSCNGLDFEYLYTFSGDDRGNNVVGKIGINSLDELVRVYGYETSSSPGVKFNGSRYVMRLSLESKIFELAPLLEQGKVVLVYLYPKYVPTIWLLANNFDFYYLAIDIATYLRMAVKHLGIPNWQLIYSPRGVPQWTENMFSMLAPHLLPLNKKVETMIRNRTQRKDDDSSVPLNKLDPNLFNVLPRPILPAITLPQWEPPQPEPEPEKPKSTKKKLSPYLHKVSPRFRPMKSQKKTYGKY